MDHAQAHGIGSGSLPSHGSARLCALPEGFARELNKAVASSVKGATCALCCDNSIVLLSLQRVISVALTDGELNELVTHHALDKAHQLAELAAGIPHRMHAGEFGLQHLLSLTDQPERANKVSVRQKPTDALLRCHTNS
jgi:hypothetical protein